ncbi:MAG TPA: zinc-binding dehydrogenase [Thermoplasmata archaeon]|jgi:L-iditol 2-dehydrogenase
MGVKAVVLREPHRLELQEFPEPTVEDGMMRVKMLAAGICGTDRHVLEGKLHVDFPIIPGHENLGVVEELRGEPKDVEGRPLAIGDRITWDSTYWKCGECYYCKWLPSNYGTTFCERAKSYGFMSCSPPPHLLGGWAESIVLYPSTWVYSVPRELTNEEAVLVDVLASASGVERAVFHASWLNMGLGLGQTVVVQGAGPVAVCSAIKAQLLGATRVIMVGAPSNRLGLAREFGVDETVDITQIRDARERVKAVHELTGGIGADVVVECAGVPAAVPEGLEMLRHGGVFVETGHFTDTGTTVINPHKHLCYKDVTLLGQWAYSSAQYRKDLALLLRHRARFPFRKLVTHRFALPEYDKAMETVRQEQCLKAIFAP